MSSESHIYGLNFVHMLYYLVVTFHGQFTIRQSVAGGTGNLEGGGGDWIQMNELNIWK